MGIAFQMYAVEPSKLDSLRRDAEGAFDFLRDHYTEDIPGECVYLDKAGMGIMESFGLLREEAVPPAAWIFGAEEMDLGEAPAPFLTADQVAQVAAWIVTVTDDEFRTIAGFNEMDTDVDYLAHHFAKLREFYRDAAANGSATFTYISG